MRQETQAEFLANDDHRRVAELLVKRKLDAEQKRFLLNHIAAFVGSNTMETSMDVIGHHVDKLVIDVDFDTPGEVLAALMMAMAPVIDELSALLAHIAKSGPAGSALIDEAMKERREHLKG